MVLDDEMALNGEVVWDGGTACITRLQVQLQQSRITRVKVEWMRLVPSQNALAFAEINLMAVAKPSLSEDRTAGSR